MEVIFKLNYFVTICINYVLSMAVYIQVYKLVFILKKKQVYEYVKSKVLFKLFLFYVVRFYYNFIIVTALR